MSFTRQPVEVFRATGKQTPPTRRERKRRKRRWTTAAKRQVERERKRGGEEGKSELANYRDFSVRATKFEAKLAHLSALILV